MLFFAIQGSNKNDFMEIFSSSHHEFINSATQIPEAIFLVTFLDALLHEMTVQETLTSTKELR